MKNIFISATVIAAVSAIIWAKNIKMPMAPKTQPISKTIVIKEDGTNRPLNGTQLVFNKKIYTTNEFGEATILFNKGNNNLQIINETDTTIHNVTINNNSTLRQSICIKPKAPATNNKGFTEYDSAPAIEGTSLKIMEERKVEVAPIKSIASLKEEAVRSDSKTYKIETSDAVACKAAAPLNAGTYAWTATGNTADKVSAGTLTTGEVNDFTKWKMWNDFSKEDLKTHIATWSIFTDNRYTVQLKNAQDNPIVNASVELRINNKAIWTARTDNTGKAELWHNIFAKTNATPDEIKIFYEGKSYEIINPKEFKKGINYFTINTACNYSNDVDIAFVVDATGSMGDEINYLKSEISDVINRTQKVNKALHIRTASVFYKDDGDEYVTRINNFSSNLNTTQEFIAAQSADGGGDFPEAVDEALAAAIQDLEWNTKARTRIIFLVLDAPPHESDNVKARYRKLIELATTQGIRIVPLAGSGIDKSTEYLMRATALATNGSYTFLTDDSGIGETHLKPSTKKYKVEKMNDLLIRLLTEFTYIPECNETTPSDPITKNNQNPFNEVDVNELEVFPNPTQGQCTVRLPKGATELLITDLTGKIIQRIVSTETASVTINLEQLTNGVYFVRALKGNDWFTKKIVLNK